MCWHGRACTVSIGMTCTWPPGSRLVELRLRLRGICRSVHPATSPLLACARWTEQPPPLERARRRLLAHRDRIMPSFAAEAGPGLCGHGLDAEIAHNMRYLTTAWQRQQPTRRHSSEPMPVLCTRSHRRVSRPFLVRQGGMPEVVRHTTKGKGHKCRCVWLHVRCRNLAG